jgi:predicted ATPase
MRLAALRIENFRAFLDEIMTFDDYTCVVGPNGAGKSTILAALNVIFRNQDSPTEVAHLQQEDFHRKDVTKPVRLTATFEALSPEAKDDLKAYVRQEKLIVSAVAEWDERSGRAEVKQVGVRQVMKPFAPFFKAYDDGAKVADLRQIFDGLRPSCPGLVQVATKDGMRDALRAYEEAHPEDCELVESEDQFYGWSKGTNRLERHLQWVCVPAVKDATDEQNEGRDTALGRLLQRTIRSKIDFSVSFDAIRSEASEKYRDVLTKEQGVLADVGAALERRLREWSHPGARVELVWNYDDQKSVSLAPPLARAKVGEGAFLGDLARLGHGLQRSFLVALLQELASIRSGSQPNLMLAVEEPELYQHPPQAKHLAAVLEALTGTGTQVIVTTHSPYFISGRGFETVRLVRKSGEHGRSSVRRLSYEQLSDALAKALGELPRHPTATMAAVEQIMQPSQSELFFSTVPILVEGTEDVAILSTWFKLSGRWTEFRRFGCHFVICEGKNTMSRPLAIAVGLGIPAFVLCDGDSDDCGKPENRKGHERDNGCLLRLAGLTLDAVPSDTHWTPRLVMWRTKIFNEICHEIGADVWEAAEREARTATGFDSGVGRKNPLLLSATLERLWGNGIRSAQLEKLCSAIIAHAKQVEVGTSNGARA